MLLVQDNLIKLGGIKLSGQIKSISISETATIENIEDDKGKTKANQPTGYEAAKISVEFILEDSSTMTQAEQIEAMQRLFKAYGQKKAKLMRIVNEDCSVRGISKVYFQKLSTKNVISESKRTATLELLAPVIAGIKTRKKSYLKISNPINKSKRLKSLKSKNKSPIMREKLTGVAKNKAKVLVKAEAKRWDLKS
ncbi:MAG: hypothetical protein K2M60_05775 [Lachnospiraceae bacterium]|nr:hypothetical protein [Lachnospiraceae bacterium]MDE6251164.1 hypothetical protein [Lachnospiraceae bacterium]